MRDAPLAPSSAHLPNASLCEPAVPAHHDHNAWREVVARADLETLHRGMQAGIDLKAWPEALRIAALRIVGRHLGTAIDPSPPSATGPTSSIAHDDRTTKAQVDLAKTLMVALVSGGTNPFTTRLNGLASSSVFQQAAQAQDPAVGLAMVDAIQRSGQPLIHWALPVLAAAHPSLLLRALEYGWGHALSDEEDRQAIWCTVVRRTPLVGEPVAHLADVQVTHLHALCQHGVRLRPAWVLRTMNQVITEVPRLDGENRRQRADRQLRLLTAMDGMGMTLTPDVATRLLPRALNQRAPMTLVQHLLKAGANPTGVQDKLIERERIELRETFRAAGSRSKRTRVLAAGAGSTATPRSRL